MLPAAADHRKKRPPADDTLAASAVKTGLAVILSAAKSVDAGDANGAAQADSLAVAVTVDDAGKIVKCSIDQAQTKIEFSKEGKLVTHRWTASLLPKRRWVQITVCRKLPE